MKNRIKIVILLLIVIGACIIAIIYNSTKYSLENITELLISQNELPNNVYIEEEHFDNKSKEVYLKTKTYIKDNMVYTYQDGTESQNAEQLYDFNNDKLIIIVHDLKTVTYFPAGNSDKENIVSSNFNYEALKSYKEQYKYLGKEKIDDKVYIKFSITEKEFKNIFYLDIENKYISKIEYYVIDDNNGYKIESTNTYKYVYDVVRDEDILKFDSNNYPDYTLQGEIN